MDTPIRTLAALAAGLLIAVAPAWAQPAPPATQPDALAAPATQPDDDTPADARALLDILEKLAVDQEPNAQDYRAVADYTIRVSEAAKVIAQLQKNFPAVASRPQVRRTELAVLFAMSRMRGDTEAKALREAIDRIQADASAPRSLKAEAGYYELNLDVMKLVRDNPATDGSAPPWLAGEVAKRVAFGKEFKEQPVGQRAWAEAIMVANQMQGDAKAQPLVDEFMKSYPDAPAIRAQLLGQLAVERLSQDPANWVRVQPLTRQLMEDYHDEDITPQVLARLTEIRAQAGDEGAAQAVVLRNKLTEDFPGDNAVGQLWRQAAVESYQQLAGAEGEEAKTHQATHDHAMKVLKQKFPETEARAWTLAQLAMINFQSKGLEAARPFLDTLSAEIPEAAILPPVLGQIAQVMLRDQGYAKAGAFIRQTLEKYPDHEAFEQLRGIVRRHEAVGKPMQMSFTSVDGKKVDLAEMRGNVVVVYFWATWCGPCIAGMNKTVALANEYEPKGVKFVGVSLDENKGDLLDYQAQQKLPWPSAFDGKGWQNDLAVAWGITSIPQFLVVNRKGELVNSGVADKEELADLLESLAGEKKE